MNTTYLDRAPEDGSPRDTRFNGPGWYVLDDRGTLVDGPFDTEERAREVIAQQYPAPPH
ncbi:hypothetical protein [Roseomonas sp. BN140053]|uniref:hypothetical protein n=1 Tax=Roseomonas sp. BN140053 TaxID=3391898 RepID=UPI0039E8FB47